MYWCIILIKSHFFIKKRITTPSWKKKFQYITVRIGVLLQFHYFQIWLATTRKSTQDRSTATSMLMDHKNLSFFTHIVPKLAKAVEATQVDFFSCKILILKAWVCDLDKKLFAQLSWSIRLLSKSGSTK